MSGGPRKPPGLRSYVAFNDNVFDHGRWSDLSHADQDKAFVFVFRAVAYSHRENTDGVVPRSKFGAVFGEKLESKLALKRGWKLCWEIGVFEDDPRGIFVHDYLDYQPSREQRESGSQTARRLNEARWRNHPIPDSDTGCENPSDNGHAEPSAYGSAGSGNGYRKNKDPIRPLVENLDHRRGRRRRSLTPDQIEALGETHDPR